MTRSAAGLLNGGIEGDRVGRPAVSRPALERSTPDAICIRPPYEGQLQTRCRSTANAWEGRQNRPPSCPADRTPSPQCRRSTPPAETPLLRPLLRLAAQSGDRLPDQPRHVHL